MNAQVQEMGRGQSCQMDTCAAEHSKGRTHTELSTCSHSPKQGRSNCSALLCPSWKPSRGWLLSFLTGTQGLHKVTSQHCEFLPPGWLPNKHMPQKVATQLHLASVSQHRPGRDSTFSAVRTLLPSTLSDTVTAQREKLIHTHTKTTRS